MDFTLTDEQQLIIKTTREFVERELYPHEARGRGHGRAARRAASRAQGARRSRPGLYAANMPAEVGGGGLDTVTWVLYEKELGRANYALHYYCVGGPRTSCWPAQGEQRERYLLPCVRGERVDCLAMTEPGAGSDLRGIKHHRRRATATTSSSTAPSISSATPTTPTS